MLDLSIVAATAELAISRRRGTNLSHTTYYGAGCAVRVFTHSPGIIALEVRTGDHYAQATLPLEHVRALIAALTQCLAAK